MYKKKTGKIAGVIAVVLGNAFVVTGILAAGKKRDSQYDNEPEQKNPFEGKKVLFVPNENETRNADGMKGHLESVGDCDYVPGIYDKYIKRLFDIVFSFLGLVLLWPVFFAIAVAIEIEDPGPVLFVQKRIGKNKKYFKLHKFRSMRLDTPQNIPTHMMNNSEQYITKVGRFIRAHSLDELPQLWDILLGNMSVVGPRPGLWNQDILTAERDKYGANDIKPGLTGWAQINGRDEIPIEVKAKLDGEYVQKESLLFDIRCIFATISKVGHDDSIVEGNEKKTGRHYTGGKSREELIGNIGFGEPVRVDTNMHRKVLITGAGSFIGESFRNYVGKYYPSLEIDTLDMLENSWRREDFSSYDIVFHVAGIAHIDVRKADKNIKEKYYSVNTDLAVEVCEKAKSEGVKEFVFMSSMIVYGDSAFLSKRKVIDKCTVPSAVNYYGDSKLQADVAVRDLADDDFKVIVLRPPMIYGKGSKGNYRILEMLAKKILLFPDIYNERSMLDINNFCEFLCQIMLIEVKQNATVLLPQNSEWIRTTDMVKEIAKASGKNIKTLRTLNPLVVIGGKMPGRIGRLVKKAFGSFCYDQSLSKYEGINYQIFDLKNSIKRIESEKQDCDEQVTVDATAIIMTRNEEKNIGECLDSMKGFAKRCVVIDCGSMDRTVEIAREKGADVYFHEFQYYAKQFNWGIDNCDIDTEWIIRLDADERFPAELCKELSDIINSSKNKNVNGITIEADYYFLGKRMSHGLRNKRKMMMFKKSCGRIEDKRRDAHSIISEGINVNAKHKFVHYDFKNLDAYIKRYNWYATREMQDYIEYVRDSKGAEYDGDELIKKQRAKKYGLYYKAPEFLRAQLWFLYNYIFKGGFLDGKEGFLFLFFECYWYRMLVDAKIYEQQKNGSEFEELKALD